MGGGQRSQNHIYIQSNSVQPVHVQGLLNVHQTKKIQRGGEGSQVVVQLYGKKQMYISNQVHTTNYALLHVLMNQQLESSLDQQLQKHARPPTPLRKGNPSSSTGCGW